MNQQSFISQETKRPHFVHKLVAHSTKTSKVNEANLGFYCLEPNFELHFEAMPVLMAAEPPT